MSEYVLASEAPVHTAMLLAGSANASYAFEVETGFLESLEDDIDGLEPESDWCIDLVLFFVCDDAFHDVIAIGICVKVKYCFIGDFEIGSYSDAFQLLRRKVKSKIQR